MKYEKPELVVLGAASSLVRGDEIGVGDNVVTNQTRAPLGIALGLDD